MSARLIILDRDGVINHERGYIKDPNEWVALPGALEAIAKLCRADYRVVVVTNQSGIAKGLYSINTLNRIHRKLTDELQTHGGAVSAFFFCPHTDADDCDCRKPKPDLFLELAERLQCDLAGVHAVGDSARDLQAAHAAGAKPVLVETGNGAATADALRRGQVDGVDGAATPVYPDLAAFADALLADDAPSDA